MKFFNIHHHFRHIYGIYNLEHSDDVPTRYFSYGIHPKDIGKDVGLMREIAQDPNCLAIGECGLDAFVQVDESLQERVFQQQILLANELEKPVIVHCVRRFSQLLKFNKIAHTPMIVHGFNKKKSIGEELLEKGFYLSFGVSFLYNRSLQEMLKAIPLDKIFLETDAVDMDVLLLYEKLAEIRKVSVLEIENRLWENIQRVFRIEN